MKVIFLDFDGVMDTSYYDMLLVKQGLPEADEYGVVFDPSCIANLKRIIKATGARVVVSSDWKYLMSYKELLGMWNDRNLPGEMIDATPNCSKHRGNEIDQWLEECKQDVQYVILDDMDASNFNEHQLSRLLVVNPYTGLDEDIAERAIDILNNSH